jgi:hypothetical protein
MTEQNLRKEVNSGFLNRSSAIVRAKVNITKQIVTPSTKLSEKV